MTKSRHISRLDDLAFEVLLRHRMEITPRSQGEYEVLLQHKLKRDIPVFLQAIADGNQDEVEAMLNDNPHIVAVGFGTVTTLSLDTIENVSAIQLTFILEDGKMGKVLADAVDKLNNPAIKAKVSEELAIKVSEIEEQASQFKKFDFTDLVNAITNDTNLKRTGNAGPETEKAFADFKEYFQPKVVTKGRPFNMKDLKESYEVYDKNFADWDVDQLIWFLRNVTRLLLGRAAASYGQAFSNGLVKPFARSFKLKNQEEGDKCDLSYYSSCQAEDVANNFSIDIYYGERGHSVTSGLGRCFAIEKLCVTKAIELEKFKQRLQPQTQQVQLELKNNKK